MSLPLVSSQILYASAISKNAPKPEIYLIKMKTNEIRIFCPATIANVSCGFDVLGLALDSVGDEMVVRKINEKGIKITKLTGQDLPTETLQNVAGVAGLALLAESDHVGGFEIEIYKKIKAGSGRFRPLQSYTRR